MRRHDLIAPAALALLLALALGAPHGPAAPALAQEPGTPAAGGAAPGTFAAEFPTAPGATYVGSGACLDCHDGIGAFYHGKVHDPARGLLVPGTAVGYCESCHGPGSVHVEEMDPTTIVGPEQLSGLPADRRAMMCLQCHRTLEQSWWHGAHGGTPVACADCHTDQAHFAAGVRPRADFGVKADFCLQCHAGQVADFRLQYHHPVLEGEMGCIDCHAPHGGIEQGLVTLLDENRPCLRCHDTQAGPFVFSHEASETEACTVCHRPHGSPNDRLLIADDNSLCLRCHYQPGFPTIGATDHTSFLAQRARCYDCHVQVHGSNIDEFFLIR